MAIIYRNPAGIAAGPFGTSPFGPRIPEVALVDPYVWLYEFQIPKDPPTRARLARSPVPIQFGTNSAGQVLTYSPYPISHPEINEVADGSIPTTRVTVSNVTLELASLIRSYELEGQPAKIMLIRLQDAPNGDPLREYSFTVQSISVSDRAVVAQLGAYNLHKQPFPLNVVKRNHCDYAYKGGRCGYNGALTTCDKTEDGPNGCTVHNNRARFGAFRGLQRLTGIGAG